MLRNCRVREREAAPRETDRLMDRLVSWDALAPLNKPD